MKTRKIDIYDYLTDDELEQVTNILINRILEVDNFQNMACFCANWKEFTEELAEWGVYSAAKIDFDDNELDYNRLDSFILKEGN